MIRRDRLIVTGLVVASIVIVYLTVMVAINWAGCRWYGHQTERETRYGAFIGCMVKIQDRWIPRDELRVVQ